MRLWTLHPKYLDSKGLVALWREALLAQKVLGGKTRGYKSHPQLSRFKQQRDPVGAVASYLDFVHDEARGRGYRFDRRKISRKRSAETIHTTRGQLLYEWQHLKEKLQKRDRDKLRELKSIREPEAHPVFHIVTGGIESWEIVVS